MRIFADPILLNRQLKVSITEQKVLEIEFSTDSEISYCEKRNRQSSKAMLPDLQQRKHLKALGRA